VRRASSTLPANPFADLDARDLGSFIECTLYETSDDEDTDPDFPIYVAAPERPPPRPAATPNRAPAPPAAPASSTRGPRRRALALWAGCACLGLGAAFELRRPPATAEQARPPARDTAPLAQAPVPARQAPAPVVEPIATEVHAEASAPPPPAVAEERAPRKNTATLIIGSSPPGAEIAVDGEPLGAAPTRLEVPRFAQVEIEATLAGYAPWKKTIYVRRAETRIGTSLRPLEPASESDPTP
jgi:PEGA domain-containing protein